MTKFTQNNPGMSGKPSIVSYNTKRKMTEILKPYLHVTFPDNYLIMEIIVQHCVYGDGLNNGQNG